ncbi:hypothetical protein [uncultured Tolumonas sp.]|uniref:hypothetical protein n=1 Tax=uncultured Tolumonas sp. TaxID=263765 RepID=UPI002A0A7F30|nr:hypothetical protein [uncultured Tolumonas sp.]
MGLFSFIKETWDEASYEIDNQFRSLGSVLRIELTSGYRYGIYVGDDEIVLVQGRKVKKINFESFKDGIGFFSAGWVKSLLFNVNKNAGQSCRCALNMLGKQVDMTNKEFALYCRTGDKDFSNYDLGKEFSLNSLQIREDTDSEKAAQRDRKDTRKKLVKKALQEHRKNLLNTAYKDLKEFLPNNLFEVENKSSVKISITTNTDKSLICLYNALSFMVPDVKQEQSEFILSTSLEAEKDIINKILVAADKKYKSGLYKKICYLESQDDFLKEFPKKIQDASELYK